MSAAASKNPSPAAGATMLISQHQSNVNKGS